MQPFSSFNNDAEYWFVKPKEKRLHIWCGCNDPVITWKRRGDDWTCQRCHNRIDPSQRIAYKLTIKKSQR